VVAVLLATALVAGCGSNSKSQFSSDFKPINDELLQLGSAVGQAVNNAAKTPDAVLAGEFLGFASRLQAIKDRIDKLKPPDDLKSDTKALADAGGRLVADLRAIGTAARNHQPAAARAATVSLVHDSQAAATARRALARKTGAKVNP
jgi:outer membrane murein-binding lipoprotein Lpp